MSKKSFIYKKRNQRTVNIINIFIRGNISYWETGTANLDTTAMHGSKW